MYSQPLGRQESERRKGRKRIELSLLDRDGQNGQDHDYDREKKTLAGVAPGSGGTFVELPKDLQDRLESAPSVSSDDSLLAPLPDVRHVFGMRVKGRLCAILAIAERSATDQPLTSEDRALLATLCSHAAAAIEAARLVREVRLHADQVESLNVAAEPGAGRADCIVVILFGQRRCRAVVTFPVDKLAAAANK